MTTPQSAPMGEQELIEGAIHAWIRDDAPLAIKMTITPKLCAALVEKVRAAASPRLAGETIQRLQRDCAEAYQVIGVLSEAHGDLTGDPQVIKALDNLSAAVEPIDPRPHDDLLPFTISAPSESVGWRDTATRPTDRNETYLVANAAGQVAPIIRGVIHNNVGSPWDWHYGEGVTHWMPLPAPPSEVTSQHGQTPEPTND